jgi:hypothetical protein
LGAALSHRDGRRRLAIALAVIAVVPCTLFLLGTYALVPWHPVVAAAVCVTFMSVLRGVANSP